MLDRTVVIVNPHSAGGATAARFDTITKLVAQLFPDPIVYQTEGIGHATQLAREVVANGITRIIAVGGDGTLNEVVNGLFDQNGKALNSSVCLGVVTSGTGGDFRKTLGWKKSIKEDLLRIRRGNTMMIDIGRVFAVGLNGEPVSRFFINEAGCGLSGAVNQTMLNTSMMFGSKVAYFYATMKALWNYRAQTIQISSNNETITYPNCSLVSFGNGQYFGGGMRIAPNARLDDKTIEQITVCNMGLYFFLRYGFKVYRGTHTALPQVSRARIKKAEVTSSSPDIFVEADGELVGKLPLRIEVIPTALQLFV